MLPHPLANFEIQKYYQNEHSKNNLPNIRRGICNKSWWLWINRNSFYVNNNVTYFDNLGVEHVPKKKNLNLNGNKSIITNIYGIQAQHTIRYCLGTFMWKDHGLVDCTNFFSQNEYEKNDKIILKYFQ